MANQTDDQKAKVDAKPADTTPARPADETDPGGRYVVNGELVDANGKPLKGEA